MTGVVSVKLFRRRAVASKVEAETVTVRAAGLQAAVGPPSGCEAGRDRPAAAPRGQHRVRAPAAEGRHPIRSATAAAADGFLPGCGISPGLVDSVAHDRACLLDRGRAPDIRVERVLPPPGGALRPSRAADAAVVKDMRRAGLPDGLRLRAPALPAHERILASRVFAGPCR